MGGACRGDPREAAAEVLVNQAELREVLGEPSKLVKGKVVNRLNGAFVRMLQLPEVKARRAAAHAKAVRKARKGERRARGGGGGSAKPRGRR